MMYEIDAILFDFDGTLVDINIDFAEMRRRIISLGVEYGISPRSDLYILESINGMFEELQKQDAAKAETFKRRAEELIVDVEMEAAGMSRMFPGADNTLNELRNKGIKIGIVTRNCRTAVLKSSQKARFVYDLLLTRDDVKKVKPNPQHLLDALVLLDSKPEKALMVGDHPMDITAGKRAGMKTAAVLTMKSNKDFEEAAPDFILKDISGILDIL